MTRIEASQAKEKLASLRAMLYDIYVGTAELTPELFRTMIIELELIGTIVKRFE